MQLKTRYITFLLGALGLLIINACSTEKDAALNKGYHNMTARYNGYYNARVILDEMLDDYREGYQEDYSVIIPLDRYPTEEDVTNMYPEIEDAIERCSKVIVRHSMPNPQLVKTKKSENCRWIDDNWLVIGKAYYIKRDYAEAEEKLKFVAESDFYRDEESVYEARIWLAKTYIAQGNYAEAKRILILVERSIEESKEKDGKEKKKKMSKFEKKKAKRAGKKKEDSKPPEFPKRLIPEYELAMAELYIAQGEYKKAIEHLEKEIDLTKDKKRKARHMFVLAQLYEAQGNNAQAAYYFQKVARSNANYEMRFKAKIRNALAATGNPEEIRKELNKMLKDGKNIEYKDQIYYALAELDMKEGNVDEAKSNYTNSVLWSIKNDRQKGESYLRLADIHFEERDYLSAQRYYDSCVQALPEDYEGYELLQNKAVGLSDLVFHYETVMFEDSVQRIAGLSPKEREKFLEKTVKDIEAEKERKRLEAERRLLAQQERINSQQAASGGAGNGNGRGKGYFANPKQVASGFNDFRGLWGQRALEDNWRRSNKSSFADIQNEDGEVSDSLEASGISVDDLLKDIPLDQAAMDSSNYRVLNSLYALGIIYKEQLKEEPEAIAYFQQVIDRKIEHPRVLPALYQLYLIYNKKGDSKASQYKTAIIKNYPDSEIAQILLDPEYLKKKELKDREELNEYSNVMRNYRRRSYGVVITKCNEVILNSPNNQFIEKYYLLKAFAVSKLTPGNVEAISDPLEVLYAKSPESEEGKQAKIYLDKLQKGAPIVEPDKVEESPYEFEPDAKHFFIVSIPAGGSSVSSTKIKISNFNKEFYPSDGLSLQDAPLGGGQILVIRTFADLTKARLYLSAFNSDSAAEILGSIPDDYKVCLINAKNFTTLFKMKDFEEYYRFYEEKY